MFQELQNLLVSKHIPCWNIDRKHRNQSILSQMSKHFQKTKKSKHFILEKTILDKLMTLYILLVYFELCVCKVLRIDWLSILIWSWNQIYGMGFIAFNAWVVYWYKQLFQIFFYCSCWIHKNKSKNVKHSWHIKPLNS